MADPIKLIPKDQYYALQVTGDNWEQLEEFGKRFGEPDINSRKFTDFDGIVKDVVPGMWIVFFSWSDGEWEFRWYQDKDLKAEFKPEFKTERIFIWAK